MRVKPDAEVGWIGPIGELDVATVGQLDGALCALLAVGVTRIVLDPSGLSFADSSAVRLSQTWQAPLAARGIEFDMTPGSPAVRRAFLLVAALPAPDAKLAV